MDQNEFIDKLLSKLPGSAIERLTTLNFNMLESEQIENNIKKTFSEIENDRIAAAEMEIRVLIKLEEIEVQQLIHTKQLLDKEINDLETFMKDFNSPDGEKLWSEATIHKYNQLMTSSKVEDYVNVSELISTHKDNEIKRLTVKQLEKYTDQFMGLPDNIADTREAVRMLSENIKSLKIKSELQTQQEVGQFNKFTMGYSSYSLKK